MKQTDVQISGGVVSWRVGRTDRRILEDGLCAIGLKEFVPEDRTPKAVLNDALSALYADPKTLVRPLQKRSAFTVVAEKRGKVTNDYDTKLSVSVNDAGIVEVEEAGEAMVADLERERIQEKYYELRSELPGATVATCLVKIITKMNGIAIRESGGVYWLPLTKLQAWSQVAKATEAANAGKDKTDVYLMRTIMDEDAMRQVRDGISGEIESTVNRIAEEIKNGDLGERALNSRVDQAGDLCERLSEYEALLGETLDTVRKQIDDVQQAAAKAVVLASAISQGVAQGAAVGATI